MGLDYKWKPWEEFEALIKDCREEFARAVGKSVPTTYKWTEPNGGPTDSGCWSPYEYFIRTWDALFLVSPKNAERLWSLVKNHVERRLAQHGRQAQSAVTITERIAAARKLHKETSEAVDAELDMSASYDKRKTELLEVLETTQESLRLLELERTSESEAQRFRAVK